MKINYDVSLKTMNILSTVQSLSCGPNLCDPVDYSTPGSSVLYYLLGLLKFVFIESVMLSNHLIFCRPLPLLPSIFSNIRVFSNEPSLLKRGGQSIGASTSAPVLPMNIQGWFHLRLASLISLLSELCFPPFSIWNQSVVPCKVLTVAS